MSHQSDIQALHDVIRQRDERISFAESAVKDVYASLHEDVLPYVADAMKAVVVARCTSRLWPVINRKWTDSRSPATVTGSTETKTTR